MAWLGHDGVCLKASREPHHAIERKVLLPDLEPALTLRQRTSAIEERLLSSSFSKEVFMFPLFAFWFSLCPCPALGT
jgi:hypothetical protein